MTRNDDVNTATCGYIRISTKPRKGSTRAQLTQREQDDARSLALQRSEIERYCDHAGLAVPQIFHDFAVSAGRLMQKRPGGEQLLAATRHGGHVVIYRLDRAFRDTADGLLTMTAWRRAGVTLHIAETGRSYDIADTTDWFNLACMLVSAENERRTTADRTRNHARRRRELGQSCGFAPFGWRNTGGRLVAVQSEQAVIALIEQLQGQGCSLRAICARLIDDRVPTARGGTWQPGTVHKILQQRKGAACHN